MKNILLAAFLLVIAEGLPAQEVLSSAGGTATVPGYELNWTVGEAVIETYIAGKQGLTQGFHQSKLTVTALDNLLLSGLVLKVYPNPTSDFLVVHFSEIENRPQMALYDLSGKLQMQRQINETDTQIDMDSYPPAAYLLRITRYDGFVLQNFKIIKK